MNRCALIAALWGIANLYCSAFSYQFHSVNASNLVLELGGLEKDQEYILQQCNELDAPNWLNQGSVVTNQESCDFLIPQNPPSSFFRLVNNEPPVRDNPWPNVTEINESWLYLEEDTNDLPVVADSVYTNINLPHSWNTQDTLQSNDYRRATSWYRKNLILTSDSMKERLYLRFLGAGQRARIYVNGTEVGYHNGGYSSFSYEITGEVVSGTNRIDVWVNNETVSDVAPQGDPSLRRPDFNSYGGLYRSVQLISAPEISISRNYYGGPGFRVWSEQVSEITADLNVTVLVDNGSSDGLDLVVEAKLLDLDGSVVSSGSNTFFAAGSTNTSVSVQMGDISNPRLWTPENPELYRLELKLITNGNVVDSAQAKYGFRWFELTPDRGFFLNGESYPLRGANRHQDYYGKANALPLEQHYRDLMLMKEAGCNWIRLAHYQQDDYVLQLCDQLGLLVWEEIPYVGGGSPGALEDTLRSMMREMIEQHFNYSSVIIWGMGNELYPNTTLRDFLLRMKQYVHELDPIRKAGYVSHDKDEASSSGVAGAVDVIGYNLYRGWYGGTSYDSLTSRITELHNMDPDIPLILTEFGAGSDLSIHSDSPRAQDFSVEYQNDFLESHLVQVSQLNWLCGSTWWAFCDFGSVWRGDSMPHINQKGVVTFSRERKDAFYLMKSYWSDEPVVYIESPFRDQRDGDVRKNYRVFSNMDSVELFHNGTSLGIKNDDFEWVVDLQQGTNTLEAIGQKGPLERIHRMEVTYGEIESSSRISVSAAQPSNPGHYLDDQNLSTRWAAEGDQTVLYELDELSTVSGVRISFYKGDERRYELSISGWNADEVWVPLYAGYSAQESGLQDFTFDVSHEIKTLRIETLGNSENEWNSYYEIIPVISGK